MGCAVVPASFDPADTNLQAFPRPLEWIWYSCSEALKRQGAKGALVRIPLFWQIISPIHRACAEAQCGLFVNDQENQPIGEASVRLAEIDTVITDAKDAFTFSLFLAEKNTAVSSWFIVYEPIRDWSIPIPLQKPSIQVTQEVHLFPGLPLLTQCKNLSNAKRQLFHASSDCMIEIETEYSTVSTKGTHPFPLTKQKLDIALERRGICECGEEIVGKK